MKSWLSKIAEIYAGWKNDAFPTEDILEMSEQRARICAGCPLNVNNTCSKKKTGIAVIDFVYREEMRIKGKEYPGCGCPLTKKTKSTNSKCPLGKW